MTIPSLFLIAVIAVFTAAYLPRLRDRVRAEQANELAARGGYDTTGDSPGGKGGCCPPPRTDDGYWEALAALRAARHDHVWACAECGEPGYWVPTP